MARDRRRDIATASGAVAGGSAGALLADNRLARAQLVKMLTRPGSRYRIYSSTSMAPDLFNGSGEAMMSSRLADMYRRHGIGMTYLPPTLGPYSYGNFPEGLAEYGNPLHGTGEEQISQLMSSPTWKSRDVPFINSKGKLVQRKMSGLLDMLNKHPDIKNKFLNDVRAGKYTGVDVGRLRDIAKLNTDLFKTPELIMPSALHTSPRIEFNAFRGFSPFITGWSGRAGLSHAQNLLDSVTPEGRFNLGSPMGFEANLTGKSTRLIPAVNIPVNPLNSNPLLARLIHNRDRKKIVDFISGIQGSDFGKSLDGKKIVFVSSGSVGPNTSQRLRDIVNAASRHNDVHVLFQTGTNQFAPDMADVILDLQKKHPGVLTTVGRVDASLMNKFINGADAYIPYGGSSSAIEAGAHYTPLAFATDGDLNQGNIDFIRKLRNSKSNQVGEFDNVTTAFATGINDFKKTHGRMPNENELKALVGELIEGRRVGYDGERGMNIARGLINDPSLLDKAVAHNNDTFDRLIDAADSGKRYSKETRDSIRSYIRNAKDSNRNAIDTARNVVLGILDKDDARVMASSKSALKNLFSGNSKRRSLAARRLVSGRGLKGLALSAGNTLFKSPVGRRIGIPLTALGALGVGGATYAAMKPKDDGIGDKVVNAFRRMVGKK